MLPQCITASSPVALAWDFTGIAPKCKLPYTMSLRPYWKKFREKGPAGRSQHADIFFEDKASNNIIFKYLLISFFVK